MSKVAPNITESNEMQSNRRKSARWKRIERRNVGRSLTGEVGGFRVDGEVAQLDVLPLAIVERDVEIVADLRRV